MSRKTSLKIEAVLLCWVLLYTTAITEYIATDDNSPPAFQQFKRTGLRASPRDCPGGFARRSSIQQKRGYLQLQKQLAEMLASRERQRRIAADDSQPIKSKLWNILLSTGVVKRR